MLGWVLQSTRPLDQEDFPPWFAGGYSRTKPRPGSFGVPAFIMETIMEAASRCPRCHSDEVLRVVYGMPSPEMVEESIAGRVALEGRMAWPEAPDWRCAVCGHEWRRDEA